MNGEDLGFTIKYCREFMNLFYLSMFFVVKHGVC
jgi:hypothetical protein